MSMTRLGILALALMGVDFLAEGLGAISQLIASAFVTDFPGGALFMIGLSGLFAVAAGFVLIRWRAPISTFLFGADDAEVGRVSLLDAQVVGLAILGVWLVAEGAPEVLRWFWSEPGYRGHPIAGLLGVGMQFGIGLYLIFKGDVVARMWCPRIREDSAL